MLPNYFIHACRNLLALKSRLSSQLHCFVLAASREATLEIVTLLPLETSQCKFYCFFEELAVSRKYIWITM